MKSDIDWAVRYHQAGFLVGRSLPKHSFKHTPNELAPEIAKLAMTAKLSEGTKPGVVLLYARMFGATDDENADYVKAFAAGFREGLSIRVATSIHPSDDVASAEVTRFGKLVAIGGGFVPPKTSTLKLIEDFLAAKKWPERCLVGRVLAHMALTNRMSKSKALSYAKEWVRRGESIEERTFWMELNGLLEAIQPRDRSG